MVDYKNGKTYAIRSKQTPMYYIGSTTQTLEKRFGSHKRKSKIGLGCSSDLILKYEDAYIEIIELYPCNNKEELNKREGELIRLYKDMIVNKAIAGRTHAEYYKEEQVLIKSKRVAKKDDKMKYDKKRREENHELIIQNHREYNLANKDKINEKSRLYRAKKKAEQESKPSHIFQPLQAQNVPSYPPNLSSPSRGQHGSPLNGDLK
jgi:hypothetical protein